MNFVNLQPFMRFWTHKPQFSHSHCEMALLHYFKINDGHCPEAKVLNPQKNSLQRDTFEALADSCELSLADDRVPVCVRLVLYVVQSAPYMLSKVGGGEERGCMSTLNY